MGSLSFSTTTSPAPARHTLARTLPLVAAATACACGLGSNGLLDVGDGGPDASDMGAEDGSVSDRETLPDGIFGNDSGTVDVVMSDRGDAVDAFVGDRVGAVDSATGGTDATMVTPPVDAGTGDSPSDGRVGPLDAQTTPPTDSSADGPAPEGGAPSDGSTTGPSPIVWDGGAIPDPQFDDTTWLNFCASLSACGEFSSLSACLAFMPQPASPDALIPPPAFIDAVNAAAPNCPGVGAALGDGSKCPSTTSDLCSGNSLVTCRLGFKTTIDCASMGLVCSNGNGNAGCGFGDCSAAQEGATYCVGANYVARCTSGRYVPALDCQTFSVTCGGVAGAAECQGTTRMTCSGSTSCMNQALNVCVGGSLLRTNCSLLYDPSFTCVAGGANGASCGADNACDPATYVDTCTAQGQVNVCNEGATTQYDCTVNWNGCRGGHCVP